MLSNGELMVLQRLVAELNREQEAFIANKHTEKGEAVAPWVGAPNEDILREECLSLSMVSNSSFLFVEHAEQKRERTTRIIVVVVVVVGLESASRNWILTLDAQWPFHRHAFPANIISRVFRENVRDKCIKSLRDFI